MKRRVYASINIYSDSYDPDHISKLLSTDCDRCIKTNEKIRENVFAKQNAWIYTSRDKVISEDINDHLLFLLKILDISAVEELRKVVSGSGWMRILCFWESINRNGGPTITNQILQKLAKYPLDLEFDVWFEE